MWVSRELINHYKFGNIVVGVVGVAAKNKVYTATYAFAGVVVAVPNKLTAKCSAFVYQIAAYVGNFYEAVIG